MQTKIAQIFILFMHFKAAFTSQLSLSSPPPPSLPLVNLDGSMGRQKSSLTGGHETCFLATVVVEGVDYRLQIDTGSTDTILPHSSINAYTGPTVNFSIPPTQSRSASSYADGSWWYGYLQRINVALNQTTLSALSPVYLMTFQSTAPIFAPGTTFQGLMGIAFQDISATMVPPYTVMDAWVQSGIIKENKVAFHGCPYSMQSSSWIDFGNETAYYGCNFNQQASVMMPSVSYYNVDVSGIAIGGVWASLPSTWQSTSWSFLDSCTSNIMLPPSARTALQNAITSSGAISKTWLNSGYIPQWLNGRVMIPFLPGDLAWDLLPNISFTINTHSHNGEGSVTLTLGPRQYIQANTAGYYVLMVGTVGTQYAILGLPFFSAYHIVVDRDIGKISFQIGCGCEMATDSYPKISVSGAAIDAPLAVFADPLKPIDVVAVIKADASYQGGYTWQQKIYAPYVDTSLGAFDIVKMSNTVGTARYILGFVTAVGKDGSPTWNGEHSIANLPYLNDIQAVRYFGGDVVVAFGGPSGVEMANAGPPLNTLINNYQNVLYAYSASWLDFYLTGSALDPMAVEVRNKALRAMQKSDPNPRLSFTLPVATSGFTGDAINVLVSALKHGVRIDVVNILAMDFDISQVNAGTSMSTLVQMSVRGVKRQLETLGIHAALGVTVRPAAKFSIQDAKTVLAWAEGKSGFDGIELVSVYDVNGDARAAPTPFSYSKVFVQFEN